MNPCVSGPFGGGIDRKVAPVPFPWVPLLSHRFPQLRHITLEHSPLDDCVWAEANQWPVEWLPTDDERTQRPFDSSTGNRLYEISCLRVLDQLERAIIDPSPTSYRYLDKPRRIISVGATRPNETIVAKKRGFLPHIKSVTIISHDSVCSHPKTFAVPYDLTGMDPVDSSEDELMRDYSRKWVTLYMMNRFLEIPAESGRPTAVGQTPWWPEINDPAKDEFDDDMDSLGDSDSDVGEGNFPDGMIF